MLFGSLIIILASCFNLFLAINNQLTFYIHPRFIEESIAASIFGLIIGAFGVILNLKNIRLDFKKYGNLFILIGIIIAGLLVNDAILVLALIYFITLDISVLRNKISLLSILVLFPIIGFVIPPKPLSSFTAGQRGIDLNSINYTNNQTRTSAFIADTKNYSLGEWLASLNYNPNLDNYDGKEINFSGFVYKLDESEFTISRFVVTCCAVDARPVGLKVTDINNFELEENQWVQLSGNFYIKDGELAIKPDSIENIDVPTNPYIF